MRTNSERRRWWMLPVAVLTMPLLIGPAGQSDKKLNVLLTPQQELAWCWVATAQMIMHYHNLIDGEMASQCELISNPNEAGAGYSTINCCQNDCSTLGGHAYHLLSSNGFNGIQGVSDLLPWSVSGSAPSIKAEIDADRPLIVCWQWLGGSGGYDCCDHEMVAYGYRSSGGSKYVYVHDPMPVGTGDSWMHTYSFLKSAKKTYNRVSPTTGQTVSLYAHTTCVTQYNIHH